MQRCCSHPLRRCTRAKCRPLAPLIPPARSLRSSSSPIAPVSTPRQQLKFSAYGRTTKGDSTAVAVTWQATGGSIALDGTFAADTAAGEFIVTGTNSALKLSASSRVRVRPRPVASMTVTPGSASGVVGQTFQLAAVPRDASGKVLSGRSVTWASSNTAVATVTGGGAVTAVTVGSATITATSEGKSGTASITVTQTAAPVASVVVTPGSSSLTHRSDRAAHGDPA